MSFENAQMHPEHFNFKLHPKPWVNGPNNIHDVKVEAFQ
jgi:hypothetical protein